MNENLTKEQLKSLLTDLAEDDPEFLKGLVGNIIKENLIIEKDSVGSFYNPKQIFVLSWRESNYEYRNFSKPW